MVDMFSFSRQLLKEGLLTQWLLDEYYNNDANWEKMNIAIGLNKSASTRDAIIKIEKKSSLAGDPYDYFKVYTLVYEAIDFVSSAYIDAKSAEERRTKPEIRYLSPDAGSVGDDIIIAGVNFGDKEGAVFFNPNKKAQVKSWSDNYIYAYVPAGAKNGSISFITSNGKRASGYGDYFKVTEKVGPKKDGVNPLGGISGISASYNVGDNVTYSVNGEDDRSLAKMTFAVANDSGKIKHEKSWIVSGKSARESYSFSTRGWESGAYYYSLWVKDAANNAVEYAGSFFLKEQGGKSTSTQISSFTPDKGSTGTEIIITGSGFGSKEGTVYFYPNAKAYVMSWSNTSIKVKVPSGAKTGIITVNPVTGGNATSSSSFTIVSATKPNLAPYTPSGWSDKIVVSTTTGTSSDSGSFTTSDTIYVDWAVVNNGTADINTTFYTYLYVDGVYKQGWSSSSIMKNYQTTVPDYSLGTLSAGSHTIKIVIDATGVVAESNELDNEYSKTITVQGAAGNTDTTAPTTTASPAGATFTSTQSVTLSCTDNSGGSGCDKIYYTIDGLTPSTLSTVYTTPITISSTTTLKFFSVDKAGNQEEVKTETYTISTGGGGGTTYTSPSFTDNGNGTVTDSANNLMWQQGENSTYYNWYVASGTYDASYNSGTTSVCGSLSLAGYSGWRLPTIDELKTLIDTSRSTAPYINTTFFPNAYSYSYWSSTTYAGEGSLPYAWHVYFTNGYISNYRKSTTYRARCVRGGQ